MTGIDESYIEFNAVNCTLEDKQIILLLASADGKLDFKKTIDELIEVGFRLSEKEYKRILSLNKTLSYKL